MTGGLYVEVKAKSESAADFTLENFLSRVNEDQSKYVFIHFVGFKTNVHVCACMN